ncbi:hypothetical protein [Candidatus Poriferisocius sp.]|uniref:hypothetical protein n=1 Tax=Candidatus Poriferisocius sp. TaxID=3101276 RepID=UPI003B52C4EE
MSFRRIALLVTLVLLAAGCTTKTKELPQGPPREIRIINNVEVADDDRTLTVRYWGTECEEFSDAEIDYGITQIEIAVYALVINEECQRSGLQQTEAITLDQPLDNRIIIDANTDTVVWEP